MFFLFVSKNYVWLLIIGASMNFFSFLGFLFFLDESPLYLYNKHENEKADMIVERILRFNYRFKKRTDA